MKGRRLSPCNLYEEADKRLIELREVQRILQKEIETAPEGSIHFKKNGKSYQYYLRKHSESENYISSRKSTFVKQLLQKHYNERAIRLIHQEIRWLEQFIAKTNGISQQIQQIYSNYPEQIQLQIYPIDLTDEEYKKQWLNATYEPKPIPEDVPYYKTDKGELVRSKSELNIANTLYKRGIPYIYECPLTLTNGIRIYPDFTILHPRKRTNIYWEHRGMMDDREYAKHTVRRMKEYQKNNLFLGENLIITEETATIPLGTDEIHAVISRYFE